MTSCMIALWIGDKLILYLHVVLFSLVLSEDLPIMIALVHQENITEEAAFYKVTLNY